MIEDIICHGLAEYPRESCGLIVRNGEDRVYKPCKNMASDNNHFVLSPFDYASVEGIIEAIVHSHPDQPSSPSDWDIKACNMSKLPWWIVSIPSGDLTIIQPKK